MTDERSTCCSTFSVVALDTDSGRLGSAVASRYFAVGAVVPHFRQGIGVVNSQSWCNRRLAVQMLDLMAASGTSPDVALQMALSADETPDVRQVIAIDVQGRPAVWTGEECTPEYHHIVGDGFVVAGNTLLSKSVIDAMAEVMESDEEVPFGRRLIRALEAADAAGGDKRGKQSAGVAIVPGDLEHWGPDYLDLRSDDSEDPVGELLRLYYKRWRESGW